MGSQSSYLLSTFLTHNFLKNSLDVVRLSEFVYAMPTKGSCSTAGVATVGGYEV